MASRCCSARADMLVYQRILDMRRGVMLTEWRQRDRAGPSSSVNAAPVSLADRALGLQLVRLEVEQGNAEVTVTLGSTRYWPGLIPCGSSRTSAYGAPSNPARASPMACAAALATEGIEQSPRALGPFRWSWNWASAPRQAATFHRHGRCGAQRCSFRGSQSEALDALGRAKRIGWRGVLAEHEAAWAERWRLSDIAIKGDDPLNMLCGLPSTI